MTIQVKATSLPLSPIGASLLDLMANTPLAIQYLLCQATLVHHLPLLEGRIDK